MARIAAASSSISAMSASAESRAVGASQAAREEPVLGLHVVEHGGDLRAASPASAGGAACARWARCRRRRRPRAPTRARRASSRRPISSSTPGSDSDEEAVDVLAVEVGAAHGDRGQPLAPLLQPARERGVGVELDRAQRAPPHGHRRGRGPRACPSASPSEWAGSVETTRTRRPDSARPTAAAAEQVVLPTPPLPPKKRKRGARDAGDARRAVSACGRGPPRRRPPPRARARRR